MTGGLNEATYAAAYPNFGRTSREPPSIPKSDNGLDAAIKDRELPPEIDLAGVEAPERDF